MRQRLAHSPDRAFQAARVAIAVLASAAVVTGCSAGLTDGHGTTIGGTTAATAARSGHGWAVTDARSGIRFVLPTQGRASTTAEPDGSGGSVQVRTYSAGPSPQASDAVSFFPIRVVNLNVYADRYISTFVTQFRSVGAVDPTVTNRRSLTVEHRPAVTFEFTFTAKDGTKPAWLIGFVATPQNLLILQCFDSSPNASLPRLRADQAGILASLRIP